MSYVCTYIVRVSTYWYVNREEWRVAEEWLCQIECRLLWLSIDKIFISVHNTVSMFRSVADSLLFNASYLLPAIFDIWFVFRNRLWRCLSKFLGFWKFCTLIFILYELWCLAWTPKLHFYRFLSELLSGCIFYTLRFMLIFKSYWFWSDFRFTLFSHCIETRRLRRGIFLPDTFI